MNRKHRFYISIFLLLACVFYFDKLLLGPYSTIRLHDSCKGIIEAHGGNIWAESSLGEGSIFSFSLMPSAPAN